MATPPDEPVDPLLPARLRANDVVTEGERRIERSYWEILTAWLDSVRQAVLAPFRRSGEYPTPEPVRSEASQQAWDTSVQETFLPSVAEQLGIPYSVITDENPNEDPFVTQYLQEVTVRMRSLPIEVYADLVTIIERGIADGSSVPEIAESIETRMTASASPYWPNRATVVARTETIGATNAGAYAGAVRRAQAEGDEGAELVWLATEDARTRPSHREADAQRVPIAQPFTVGGSSLRFPGDPTGPPQETINCRCSLLSVVSGEDLDWTSRQFEEGE